MAGDGGRIHTDYKSVIIHSDNLIMLATCSPKQNVTVWHLSVCFVGICTVTHQGAACDAASVHFGPTVRRTDPLVVFLYYTLQDTHSV